MNLFNCACFSLLLNWVNRFGNRLEALEHRVEYLEKHVIIEIPEKDQ